MSLKNINLREAIFIQLGFDSEKLPILIKYFELLWLWNERLNLFSRQTLPQDLIDNHLVDCVLPLAYFPKGVREVADFGTGGGLPAVIFAIQFPEIQFYAYEKSPKKREFLTVCQKELSLNLKIFGEIPRDFDQADLVIARAFKPLDVLLMMSQKYFEKGGKYFLLKGKLEKIEQEKTDAIKQFKKIKMEVIPLQSPLLEVERNLVLIN